MENKRLTLEGAADILLCKDMRTIKSYIEKGLIPEIAIDKESWTIDAEILAKKMGVLDFNEPFISEVEAKEILQIDSKTSIFGFCKKNGVNLYRLNDSRGAKFLFRKSDLQDKNNIEIKALPFAIENILRNQSFQDVVLFLDRMKRTDFVISSDKEATIFFLHLEGKSTKEIAQEVSTSDCSVTPAFVLSRIKKFSERMKSRFYYLQILMNTFKGTRYFGMEPGEILKHFERLERENKELKDYVSKVKKGQITPGEVIEKAKSEEEIEKDKLLDTHIADLDFSVRLYHALKYSEQVETLRDVVNLSINDILKFRNFGKKSLSELEEFIRGKKLKFRED